MMANPQNNTISRSFVVTVNSLNKPPTLNPISDVVVNQNSGTHSVALSGISSGSPSEHQTLTVSAVSDHPEIVTSPIVGYTSPSAAGTLYFAPAADAMGQAVITVAVNDNQSGNNLLTRNFTVSVGVIRPPRRILRRSFRRLRARARLKMWRLRQFRLRLATPGNAGFESHAFGEFIDPTLIANGNIVFGGSDSNRTVTLRRRRKIGHG